MAVRERRLASVIASLGLEARVTDKVDEDFYAFEMRNGWSVACAFGYQQLDRLSKDRALTLSEGTTAIIFECIDSAMGTEIESFSSGVSDWRIEYGASTGVSEPTILGTPPVEAEKILPRLLSEQSKQDKDDPYVADHVYELTSELGQHVVGFRHDALPEPSEVVSALTIVPVKKKSPWWKF